VLHVGRRQYKRQYSQPSRQQTIQRSMAAGKTAAVTPKLLRGGAEGGAGFYTDDVNDYSRGGACAVHRPLPSLPRRMEDSWAKSVRSDASGSDASLHWDTLDADTVGVNVDDLPPPVHSRAVRCRSVAAGAGDYSSAGRGDDRDVTQSVRDVPGYRTMPRPGAQYGVLVADEVDQRHLQSALQLRRQSRPTDNTNVRQYANIMDNSVEV